jgi:beta-lactamase regulating signal transducer with metallopeptidase domain
MSAPLGFDRLAIDALGWTLLHFVWQGVLIAMAFAAVDRLLSRGSANVRYLVACGTMLVMLLVPIGTFVVVRDAGAPGAPGPGASIVTPQGVASAVTGRPASRPTPVTKRPGSGTPDRVAPPQPIRPAPIGRLVREALAGWAGSAQLAAIFPWLVMAWGMGVLALSIRLLGGWWLVRRIRDSIANAPLPDWQPRLAALSRRIGVSRPVRLFRSALVQVPTAIGWLHPVILLPASTLTGLSPGQIESILAHELAHIRRHDFLVNLLQSLVETLLFYHPGVWWVSRRIREERELCCDDLAVGVAGDPVLYAEALCRLERLRGEAVALAVAASGGSLLARITRLCGVTPRGHEPRSRGPVAVLGAAAVVALMMSPAAQDTRGGIGAATAALSPPALAIATGSAPAAPAVHAAAAVETALSRLIAASATATPVLLSRVMVSAPVPVSLSVGPVVEVQAAAALAEDGDASGDAAPAAAAPSGRLPYTIDEWIELSRHGVNPGTVARFEAAGLKGLPAGELMALVDNGVQPEYAAQVLQGSHGKWTAKDMVRLAQHGITPEFISSLGNLGAGDLSTDDLIRLADNGVTPEWYAAMLWSYPDLTIDRAIRLRAQGIDPGFASQIRIVGRGRFTVDGLEKMRVQGLSPEYVAQMVPAMGSAGPEDLIRLYQQGVTPEYASRMRIARRFGVDELIALYQQGVTPEFVFGMAAAGYPGLGPQDLIRLYQNGVDAEFVASVADAGYPRASVSEIIRMRQNGLPCTNGK